MNPIPWFCDLLYGSRPAEFTSAFGLEDSVERLRSVTVRMTLFPTEEVMVGRVSANRVVLRRVTPMMHNSYAPVFTGRFEIRGGGIVLVGKFSLSRFTRVFMSSWFGGIALWTCLVTVGAFMAQLTPSGVEVDVAGHHEPWLAWIFPPFGIAMFLLGVLMFWGGKRWARGDQAWLSDRIAKEFGGASNRTTSAAILATVPGDS